MSAAGAEVGDLSVDVRKKQTNVQHLIILSSAALEQSSVLKFLQEEYVCVCVCVCEYDTPRFFLPSVQIKVRCTAMGVTYFFSLKSTGLAWCFWRVFEALCT